MALEMDMTAAPFILLASNDLPIGLVILIFIVIPIVKAFLKGGQGQEDKRQEQLAKMVRDARLRRQKELQDGSLSPAQKSIRDRQDMRDLKAARERQHPATAYQPVKPPPLSPPARPAARPAQPPQRGQASAQRPQAAPRPAISPAAPLRPEESEAWTARGVRDEVGRMQEQLAVEERQRDQRMHEVEHREQLVGPGAARRTNQVEQREQLANPEVTQQLGQAQQRQQLAGTVGEGAAEDRRDPGIRVNLQDHDLAMRAIILAEILSRPKALRMELESWER